MSKKVISEFANERITNFKSAPTPVYVRAVTSESPISLIIVHIITHTSYTLDGTMPVVGLNAFFCQRIPGNGPLWNSSTLTIGR